MYINFNGHHNRQKLRKEINSGRGENLGKRKESLTEFFEEDSFPEIFEEQITAAKQKINLAHKKTQRKELILYIFFELISLLITIKIISFFL